MALGRRDRAARRSDELEAARSATHRGHRSLETRTGEGKALRRPAVECRRVVWGDGFHEGAAFVARRADEVLEEGVRHAVRIMVGVDDQEIDRADEPTSADRGPKGQDGPAHDDALRLGDEDAGLRKVHQLAHEVRGIERAGVTAHTKVRVAQCDETIDIGDTGCSDQVFHAEGSYLAGRRPSPLDRGVRPVAGTFRPATPPTASMRLVTCAPRARQGCGRPVLHSGRRWL